MLPHDEERALTIADRVFGFANWALARMGSRAAAAAAARSLFFISSPRETICWWKDEFAATGDDPLRDAAATPQAI
jgi:hypothetical protein